MKKPIVFMFSGQGSHYYQMGRELFEEHNRFRLWMEHCDTILKSLIDTSLIDILYSQHKRHENFDRLLYTNPALLCIQYSLARLLKEMGIQPDMVLGYSAGEITAAVVAGVISLEDGLALSVDVARVLEANSPKGGMLAIVDSENIYKQYPEIFSECWVACKNFDKNFVISGAGQDVTGIEKQLDEKQILSQRLAVNYAFHTPVMDSLRRELLAAGRGICFNPPKIPYISCYAKARVEHIDEDHIWSVIRYPVFFSETVRNMSREQDYIFIDVGPSGTLATLLRYLLPENSGSLSFDVMNQFGKDIQSLETLRVSFLNRQ